MEEIRYFGRLAVYALLVGGAYWFLSYAPAGTVRLIGFGLATGAAFVVLRRGVRQEHPGAGPDAGTATPEAPFADESGPVPTRSGAPLAVGFGIAAVALAGAFGPWFIIAGAVPLLLGAVDWLRAAEHELALRSSTDDAPTGEAAHGGQTATHGGTEAAHAGRTGDHRTEPVEAPTGEATEAG